MLPSVESYTSSLPPYTGPRVHRASRSSCTSSCPRGKAAHANPIRRSLRSQIAPFCAASSSSSSSSSELLQMAAAFLVSPTLPTAAPRRLQSRRRPRSRAQTPRAGPSTKPTVTLTPLQNNTFSLHYAGSTILIDPWLTDDLVFLTPSFFRSSKPPPRTPALDYAHLLHPASVDAIVLTQGLPDHAHPPTLSKFARHIPVVAPSSAIPLLKSLDYRHVTEITYGETTCPIPGVQLRITALRGSVVGPPWEKPQLAYVFEFGPDRATLYHEPHGNHDHAALRTFPTFDAVVAPVVSTFIPLLANYSLVNGVHQAVRLCQTTTPTACVVFDNSGGEATGFLTGFLKNSGGVDAFLRAVDGLPGLECMKVVRTDTAGEPVVVIGPHV